MAVATARALIGDGGMLRQVEARCHLTRPATQIGFALLITWVPTMLLAIVQKQVTGTWVGLLHDPTVHVRVLIATPLLLFLDRVFPQACTTAVDRLGNEGFITAGDQERFAAILDRVRRLCERWFPEAMLAVLALLLGASTLLVDYRTYGFVTRAELTAADWWYGLVALPLFDFLLFRSLWRWAIWVRFLFDLSRIDLDLEPVHPDQRCGIGFLRRPSLTYCSLVLFAVSAVLSAAWSSQFRLSSLTSFVPLLLVFAAVGIAVAFGPLLLFVLPLHRARRRARGALGGLLVRNARWFRARWFDSAAGEALESSDAQSLDALASTYRESVTKIRVLLVSKSDLVRVAVVTLLPVVPTMIVRIPHHEWARMTSFLISRAGIP
jgi:hypothetical protein